MRNWSVGDRVTVPGDTDHPEGAVGVVSMVTADGGVLVWFPRSGGEVYHPDDLAPVRSEGSSEGAP